MQRNQTLLLSRSSEAESEKIETMTWHRSTSLEVIKNVSMKNFHLFYKKGLAQ